MMLRNIQKEMAKCEKSNISHRLCKLILPSISFTFLVWLIGAREFHFVCGKPAGGRHKTKLKLNGEPKRVLSNKKAD